jgi:hypothetical protein
MGRMSRMKFMSQFAETIHYIFLGNNVTNFHYVCLSHCLRPILTLYPLQIDLGIL